MIPDRPGPRNQSSARLRQLGEAERRLRPFYDHLARRIAAALARDNLPGAIDVLAELLGETRAAIRVALVQLATEGATDGHHAEAA
jgi:hypothetical protein